MKPEDQIKALAELDGWEYNPHSKGMISPHGIDLGLGHPNLTRYLTSRDAIVPLIHNRLRHEAGLRACFCIELRRIKGLDADPFPVDFIDLLCATPAQLCEALLHATGKWTE